MKATPNWEGAWRARLGPVFLKLSPGNEPPLFRCWQERGHLCLATSPCVSFQGSSYWNNQANTVLCCFTCTTALNAEHNISSIVLQREGKELTTYKSPSSLICINVYWRKDWMHTHILMVSFSGLCDYKWFHFLISNFLYFLNFLQWQIFLLKSGKKI